MESELVNWWFNQPQLPFLVTDYGQINPSDGPDIYSCQLSIKGIQYAGSIEIDVEKKNWYLHGHFQSAYFRDCLLHIYNEIDDSSYLGHRPHFSYCIASKQLIENQGTAASFMERKLDFLRTLSQQFCGEDLFWISLARCLGLYHNRDVMTYLAIKILSKQSPLKKSVLLYDASAYTKSVRPLNRLERRLDQFIQLMGHKQIYSQLQDLIRQRLPHQYLLNEISKLFNHVLSQKLGQERLYLYIINGFIPLMLFKSHQEEFGFRFYLHELFQSIKSETMLNNKLFH